MALSISDGGGGNGLASVMALMAALSYSGLPDFFSNPRIVTFPFLAMRILIMASKSLSIDSGMRNFSCIMLPIMLRNLAPRACRARMSVLSNSTFLLPKYRYSSSAAACSQSSSSPLALRFFHWLHFFPVGSPSQAFFQLFFSAAGTLFSSLGASTIRGIPAEGLFSEGETRDTSKTGAL